VHSRHSFIWFDWQVFTTVLEIAQVRWVKNSYEDDKVVRKHLCTNIYPDSQRDSPTIDDDEITVVGD
jgi:hypothetical protein